MCCLVVCDLSGPSGFCQMHICGILVVGLSLPMFFSLLAQVDFFFFFPAKASTLKMCKWPRSDPTACWASHYGFSMSFYIPGLVRGNAKLEFEMKEGKELTFAKYLPWTKHCACCLTHDILFNPLNKLLNCVLSLTPYHEEIEAIRSLFLFTYLFLFF